MDHGYLMVFVLILGHGFFEVPGLKNRPGDAPNSVPDRVCGCTLQRVGRMFQIVRNCSTVDFDAQVSWCHPELTSPDHASDAN